jgi:hypothetical protein
VTLRVTLGEGPGVLRASIERDFDGLRRIHSGLLQLRDVVSVDYFDARCLAGDDSRHHLLRPPDLDEILSFVADGSEQPDVGVQQLVDWLGLARSMP